MAIEIRFATQVNYPAQQNVLALPIFHTAEQFIQDCQLLLNRRVSPHQTLNDKTSLIQSIFPYLYAGRFDDHLDVLLPLIQSMDNVGANFSEMVVVDKETVDGGWDLACHQAALLHCRNLAKKQHPNTRMARQIFEIVGRSMDLYDCLFIGHLEGIITLLRQTNVNPNEPVSDFFGKCLMEEVFKNIASNLYADSLDAFPDLVRALLERHGNPNLQFKTIDIQGKGKYQNATCLHVTYLYCQSLKASGKVAEAKYVRKAFLHLLRDPRIDVRAKFTEIALERGGGSFFLYKQ